MSPLERDFTNRILAFAQQAGKLALANQKTARREYKADKSVVTETDLAISKMMQESFADLFKTPDHILIDEESIHTVGAPDKVLGAAPYHWVLDPIDGTAPYANGRNTWGVSLGVLKEGKPWLGMVYMPAVGELFFANSTSGWVEKHPFSTDASRAALQPVDVQIGRQTFFEMGHPQAIQKYFPALDEVCWLNGVESAVQGTMSTVMGRACGCVFGGDGGWSLWDYAGSWAIARAAGLDYRDVATGKDMDQTQPHQLKQTWKAGPEWLLSSERNFHILREHMLKAGKKKVA